jgi:hypothetical protein
MSRLIEKERKHYIKCKVVMLASNGESQLYKTMYKLCRSSISYKQELSPNQQNQHLYITSDNEIKEGDWYLTDNNKVLQATNTILGLVYAEGDHGRQIRHCQKIIATTDPLLGYTDHRVSPVPNFCSLPSPSESFIKAYIEAYNNGNVIDSILIEVDYHYERAIPICKCPFTKGANGYLVCTGKCKIPKLKDNNIIIKKVKDSWSREEMCSNMQQYMEYCKWSGYITPMQWIEENL